MATTTHNGSLRITQKNAADPRWQHLTEVTGYLEINADNFTAPVLQTAGNLYILADNSTLPVLQTAESLHVYANGFQAPALKNEYIIHRNNILNN